jgi:hypothetical protein
MTTPFVRLTVSLFGSASLLGLSTAAHASHVLFSTDPAISEQALSSGEAIAVSKGTTQIALDNGSFASFVDAAQFAISKDGSVDLRTGSVTVVSPKGAPVQVIMPKGVKGSVAGVNGSASFSVGGGGVSGSAIAGRTTIAAPTGNKAFTSGQFWAAAPGQKPHQVVAPVPASVPQTVQKMRAGGIAATASNGLPVALGEALAAAGANGDILGAARRIDAYDRNPSLTALPQGDYVRLTAYAAQASAPLGGAAFNGAGADIVRSYFEYLAKGGVASDFRTGYARILLSYLDLLRAGALPSSFNAATQSQLSAYIAFIGRTDGFGALSATNRNLLDAYLTFLGGGGTPDGFNGRATSLVASYLDYVRAGGDPAKFTAASQSVVSQYLQILQSGAIKGQLTAANQALLDVYLASVARTGDGLAFSASAAGSLASFTVYLNGGGFPSQYTAIDAATLRSYLETLDATGLFDRVLGSQAGFLRSYLTYLRSGAKPDAFDKLPINILTAQAASLNAFAAFLNGGGLPSAYSALTADQITAYLAALQSANRFALTGDNAKLFADYYAFLASGGARDAFGGLPINVLTGQATALGAYYTYIQGGGTPSLYGGLTQAQVLAYLKALQDSGLFASLLGTNASFLADYYAFLRTGGNPDIYAGLPNVDLNAYAAQVSTFVAYLKSGKLPSAYGTLSVDQLRAYLNALSASGKLATLLGSDAGFLADYLAYLQTGGAPDAFNGLPINVYTAYASQLSAYLAYLNGGGLPSGYTALTAAQIRAYLDVLQANGQFATVLGANATFFSSYLAYLATGASPDVYTGLPIVTYRDYASALTLFYAFLAGGGKPSAYTALTQAQILAYLQALSNSGQITVLLGSNAAFFTGYYSYASGGGTVDSYTGLPTAGVPSPGGTIPATPPPVYVGGFPETTGHVLTAEGNGQDYSSPLQVFVNTKTGVLVKVVEPINYFGLGNTTAVDVAGDASVVIGRYTNGTTYGNNGGYIVGATGIPYTVLAPRLGALPTMGTIDYSTMAATQPVALENSGTPGTFLGQLSITFGAMPKYTIRGSLTMPEASGAVNYSFASAKDTSFTLFSHGVSFAAGLTGSGAACLSTSCDISFFGDFAGTTPANRIGLIYITHDRATPTAQNIKGAVIFGANGTFTPATPVNYQTYASALTLYYNYLAGGGVPSAYTLLTQSDIRLYLDALAAAGNSAALLGSNATFFSGYLAYLVGGGAADQYGQLPGRVAVTPPASFTPVTSSPTNRLALTLADPNASGFFTYTGGTYSAATDGTPKSYSGTANALAVSTAKVSEAQGNSSINIGRFTNGSFSIGTTNIALNANQGAHYVYMAPAGSVPQTGVVDFSLLAATKPTYSTGAEAPGTFDAKMRLAFGTTPLIAIYGTITMPEGGGTAVYQVGSKTQYDAVATQGVAFRLDSLTQLSTELLTGNGKFCNGTACSIFFSGNLSGASGQYAGITYLTRNLGTTATKEFITGAAIFGTNGTSIQGTATPSPASIAPTGANLNDLEIAGGSISGTKGPVYTIVAQTNGKLDTNQSGYTKGTSVDSEFGGLNGLIGWSRWTDGTIKNGNATATLSPGGEHHIWGTPLTNLPTSGSATYDLVGSTAPTALSGTIGSVVSASLAVAFATSKVGLDSSVSVGGQSFAFGSNGGAAAPAMALAANGTFSQTSTGNQIFGFLAGSGAAAAGVAYTVTPPTPITGVTSVSGVLAFSRRP